MSFNAGEIIAKLRLERGQFNVDLDRAKADVEEKFKDPVDVTIKPELDQRAMDEVLLEEEPLREDIRPEVKPTYAKAEAEQVGKSLASDIFAGAESGGGGAGKGGGIGNLIGAMLGQGLTKEEISSGLKNFGFSSQEIKDALGASLLTEMGSGSGGNAAAASIVKAILPTPAQFENALRGGINDLERNGGGVAIRNDFLAMFSQFFGKGGGASSVWGAFSSGGALLNPIGMSVGVAGAGGLGAALGGGLAGTAIGSAGTLAALLPGFLDIMKGYGAYNAVSTGGSTKGMSASTLGLGKQIGGLIGAGSKGLGAAETQIMPDITKFITAITKAMPLMDEFAKPAIRAMSGFFNSIDKGLGSGGFKSFVGDMSKLVGPIMKEFGKVILNLGTAFGGFLKLFGGVGAKQVGPWFVKITGEFSHFMNHVKLGHGFVNGMVTVFSNLGKILGTVFDAFKLVGTALAPVGLQIFRIAGWMAMWIGRVIKLIPPDLITAIVGVVIGLKALSVIMGIVNVIMDANPVALVIIGLVALGAVAYDLAKHWKAVWGEIKKLAHDAWVFLDSNVFKPIGDFFNIVLTPVITTVGKLWGTVWQGIQDAVTTVWKILKPIFDTIKSAIGDIVGGIGKVTGLAGKIGGGVVGGVGKVVSGISNFFAHPFGLAAGGPTPANKLQLVGENGPELFMPSTAGTVIPSGQFGGRQQIVFQIDARGHTNPQAVVSAVRSGLSASLPSLQAALARGAA